MSKEPDDLQYMSKHIRNAMREMTDAARMMSSLAEELTNTGLDKFTAQLKEALKAQKLVTEADHDGIKSARDLHKVLEEAEERLERINKLERARVKLEDELNELLTAKKGIDKKDHKSHKSLQEQINLVNKTLAETKHALNEYGEETIRAHKEGLPIIRAQIKAAKDNTSAFTRLTKEIDKATQGHQAQIKGLFTATAALHSFSRALAVGYEQMTRLSEKGLLGAIGNINVAAVRMFTSVKELEDIINANRHIIARMGSGEKGVQAFTDEVLNVKQEVMYLGKHANAAAARLIRLNNNLGQVDSTSHEYRDQLQTLIKHSKIYGGLFGDTIDQTAQLLEAQIEEEHVRGRLNNMSVQQRHLATREIAERTLNLKLMGLSNEQIIEFNNKLENMFDPKKNNTEMRVREGVQGLNQIYAAIDAFGRSSKPEHQKIAKDLEQQLPRLEKIYGNLANINVPIDEWKKMVGSAEMSEAREAINAMNSGLGGLGEGQKNIITAFGNEATIVNETLSQIGAMQRTATSTGKNQLRNVDGTYLDMDKLADKIANATAMAVGKALEGYDAGMDYGWLNEWMEKFDGFFRWLNDSALAQLGKAVLALVGVLWTVTKGFGGLINLLSKIPGLGKIFGKKVPGAPTGPGTPGAGLPPGSPGSSSSGGTKPNAPPGKGTEGKPSTPGKPSTAGKDATLSKPSVGEKAGGLKQLKMGGMKGLGVTGVAAAVLELLFGDKIRDVLPWSKAGEEMEAAFFEKFEEDMEELRLPRIVVEQRRAERAERKAAEQGRLKSGVITNQTGTPIDPAYAKKKQDEVKQVAKGEARPLLDLIGKAEGTDKGRGYNETLGYGKFTGGPVNLTEMSLNEVKALQKKMLAHPENKFNSSAVGRYQIVGTTLRESIKELGLDPNMKFTPEVQDMIATHLLKKRGLDSVAKGTMKESEFINNLSKEWASLPTTKGLGFYFNQRHARASISEVRDATRKTLENKQAKTTPEVPSVAKGTVDEVTKVIERTNPKIEAVGQKTTSDLKNPQLTSLQKMAEEAQRRARGETVETSKTAEPEKVSLNHRALGPTIPSLATPGYVPQPQQLANNITNFNAPTAKQIIPLKNEQQSQVSQKAPESIILDRPIDPIEELKRQTELLEAIVRNTLPGRMATSLGSYQEPRSQVLNGMG